MEEILNMVADILDDIARNKVGVDVKIAQLRKMIESERRNIPADSISDNAEGDTNKEL